MDTLAPASARQPLPPLGIVVKATIAAATLGVGEAVLVIARGPVRLHTPDWALLASSPAVLQLHIAAALTALVVGSVILAGPKGRRLHRTLGWTWVAAMGTVAVSSFFIRVINPGHFSWIHLLSGWTVIALPMGVAFARRRKIAAHRRAMTQTFLLGLIVAGAFTFVPGRLMWRVFLG